MREAESERRRRFEVLFREQVEGIASYCRWRSRSEGDAEDAVSEVFLIAWRRLDEVPAVDDVRPWLYATARRVMSNQARGNARRSRLGERLSAQPVPAQPEDEPTDSRVYEALAMLDPLDREILLLAEWEGLSPAEIGKATQRASATVRVRLHRARRRFRVAFEAQTVVADSPAHSSAPPLLSRCEP